MRSQSRLLILILTFAIFTYTGLAQNQQQLEQLQNMTPAQLSTFNVDDLSDAQIQMFVERFQESGYTEAEMELALKTRGLPQTQIDKLKARMAKRSPHES